MAGTDEFLGRKGLGPLILSVGAGTGNAAGLKDGRQRRRSKKPVSSKDAYVDMKHGYDCLAAVCAFSRRLLLVKN
jgi:hypothetical protein